MQGSFDINANRRLIWTTICWAAIPLVLGFLNGLITSAPLSTRLGLDGMVLGWMNDYRTAFLDCFFLANTWMGSLYALLPISSVLTVTLILRNRQLDAWLLGVGLGGATLVTYVAKQVLSRPRPELFDSLISVPTSWSFPSGHTTQIAAFSLCLGIIVFRSSSFSRLFWLVAILAGLLAASVGISRIYLQVHYPSDVFAGGIIATLWVVGLYFLLNWIKGTFPHILTP